jgi:hypothetical protein
MVNAQRLGWHNPSLPRMFDFGKPIKKPRSTNAGSLFYPGVTYAALV